MQKPRHGNRRLLRWRLPAGDDIDRRRQRFVSRGEEKEPLTVRSDFEVLYGIGAVEHPLWIRGLGTNVAEGNLVALGGGDLGLTAYASGGTLLAHISARGALLDRQLLADANYYHTSPQAGGSFLISGKLDDNSDEIRRVGDTREPDVWFAWGEAVPASGARPHRRRYAT